jgi:hypothetical protein
VSQTLEDMVANLGQPRDATVAPETTAQAVEKQIAAYLATAEKERRHKRSEIRADVARGVKLATDMALNADQLKALDQRADQAAEKHSEVTGPIQSKLATATGPARDKLLSQLTDANIALETTLDVIKRVREPLEKSHRETRLAFARCRTEQALTGGDVASPTLLCELFALKKRLEAASSRAESAANILADLRQQIALWKTTKVRPSSHGWQAENGRPIFDIGFLGSLVRRERQWSCEYVHAESERHDAMTAIDELTRDLINE